VADILLDRAHGLGLEAARDVAQRIGSELQAEYGMACRWDGEVLHFERSGVSGTLHVAPQRVRMQASLGFLMSAFKPRIEEALSRNFERYFGPVA
jgi:putative polyhydroxyalkanoate system protein